MTSDNHIINTDEKIVKVVETFEGEQIEYYAIRDTYLGYWRSNLPIDGPDAWTQDRHLRAEFDSRFAAGREMRDIWEWRRDQWVFGDDEDHEYRAAA